RIRCARDWCQATDYRWSSAGWATRGSPHYRTRTCQYQVRSDLLARRSRRATNVLHFRVTIGTSFTPLKRTMLRHILSFTLAAAGLTAPAFSQGRRGGQSPTAQPNVSSDPLLRGFEFRSIGPATMMGRVDDIQGSEKDPMIVYLGFATGGLWKSIDGGNH